MSINFGILCVIFELADVLLTLQILEWHVASVGKMSMNALMLYRSKLTLPQGDSGHTSSNIGSDLPRTTNSNFDQDFRAVSPSL